LEALAATGLRTVRYLKEIDSIELMVSNDWDPAAVELMNKNISFNGLNKEKCESKFFFKMLYYYCSVFNGCNKLDELNESGEKIFRCDRFRSVWISNTIFGISSFLFSKWWPVMRNIY